MLRSVEKKVVVRVSAQVSNRGQNIGVARFWASRGNIASQVRGALSSHCSEGGTEGADSRLSCHTVTGHKAPRKQLFCSITSTSSLLSWRRTIRNRNGDIRAFSAPIVWSWVKQTEDWSVFLSWRHEVSGSWVTRIRRRRNNSLHFRILLFKLLPKLDIEIELSESDLMLWDCEGLGENSAVLTKSAQKLPVLTKQHPHWLDKAYPHQKHFDRCCNSRSENFHFPMCYKAVFYQWNWIEFFERLVRSTFVKTSYKEENVLFSGAAMQCEN